MNSKATANRAYIGSKLIQWGNAGTNSTVTFPVPFTAAPIVSLGFYLASSSHTTNCCIRTLSKTGFTWDYTSYTCYWHAIGNS